MKHVLCAVLLFIALLGLPSQASATAKFLVLCTTACTWDNTNDTIWSLSSGGTNNTTHPTSADAVTLDANSCVGGVTCTITVNATLNVQSLTMGACTASTTGCILDFSANNNNSTMGSFSNTGTGTRTVNMGSGTMTLTAASGAVFDLTTVTNLTFNTNTSTILLSATATGSRTLNLGSKTHNNITVTNAAQNSFSVDFSGAGAATIANLTLTNVLNLRLQQSTTLTISATLTYNNGGGPLLGLIYTNGVVGTLSVAAATTFDNAVMQNITKAGAGSIAVTNGYSGGGLTTVTVTNPSTGRGPCIAC